MKNFALITCCLALFTACSDTGSADLEAPIASLNRPNVVFILVDDLGYSDIGAYNPTSFYDTPNVDSLAAQGTQFTQGYAANPVCSPSRYAILTGRHPSRINATDWFHINGWPHRSEKFNPAPLIQKLPLWEQTLAETFNEAGYATSFLGKWHLGEKPTHWPEEHGFDINIGGIANGHPANGYFSPYKNARLPDGEDGEYLTERLTSEAISIIDQNAKKNQPFFLYLSFYTVHTPLQAPADVVSRYETKRDTTDTSDSFAAEEQIWPRDEPRQVRVKQNHPTYAAMVSKMDSQVGRILKKLKDENLDDNTIVVFTSDNGGLSTAEGSPTSNLPLRGGKGWLYEGGIRVPFIVKIPGAKANGTQVDQPVVSTDFYPTLLQAAGIKLNPKQHQDGVSLAPLLSGQPDIEHEQRPIYFHYPHYSNQGGFPGAAVRLGDWKLLERFEDGKVQLFNLAQDVGEQQDLAKQQPKKVKELRAMLHAWYKEVDAQFIQDKDNLQPWSNQL
ncbi:sulfatase [Paraglaciecola aquimarina]|uniref:Sulfatase n=1 Tax=Paraglaciecola aquimarina TaxID=1235557 RepID=A0ABU3SW89_9ALTE|nr:sulfatase [Paraglaciecola aquimarina]MDU0354284.1 sulfatase [Paraglaciecola aquimarina]